MVAEGARYWPDMDGGNFTVFAAGGDRQGRREEPALGSHRSLLVQLKRQRDMRRQREAMPMAHAGQGGETAEVDDRKDGQVNWSDGPAYVGTCARPSEDNQAAGKTVDEK